MLDSNTFGGIGYIGQLACGVPSTDGFIRNLRIRQGAIGTAALDFAHDTPLADRSIFGVYQNRALAALAEPTRGWDSGPLGDGSFDFFIIPLRPTDAGLPAQLVGRAHGDRIYLSWTRNTATDLDAYLIYWDNGTGTISYTTPLDTILGPTITPRWDAPPDSGTGTGRLLISGNYTANQANITWRVKITGTGLYQYSQDAGATYNGTDLTFTANTSVSLPLGVQITFLDGLYATNDYWTITIGPRTSWVSPPLADGTYKFAIKPRDAAGNLGTASSALTATIAREPEPPAQLSATWNPDTSTATIQFTVPFPVPDSVSVYTNWSKVFGRRTNYIGELAPIATASDDLGIDDVVTIDVPLTGQPGQMLFYVRATIDGVEEHNADMIILDCLAATPSRLPAPAILSALPGPAGVVILTYSINIAETTPATIAIYIHDTATPDWSTATPAETIAFTEDTYAVTISTYTTAPLTGTHWFTIRAIDSDGNETTNTDVTPCTPDATAPTAVTLSQALPT